MTKKQIAKAVADRTGTTDLKALAAVQATLDVIRETMEAGGRIELRGFGVFDVVGRKGRRYHAGFAGRYVTTPAHETVRFRVSDEVVIHRT